MKLMFYARADPKKVSNKLDHTTTTLMYLFYFYFWLGLCSSIRVASFLSETVEQNTKMAYYRNPNYITAFII